MVDKKEYMTFKSGRSLYAVPIENVLTINSVPDEIHCRSFSKNGVMGVVEYMNAPVVVFDFAQATNMKSSIQEKYELTEILAQHEQDQVDWFDALERSIKEGVAFTKEKNSNESMLGIWYDTFETGDEDLLEIKADIDQPLKRMYALADQLLDQCAQDEKEQAKEILEHERQVTLLKLRQILAKAKDYLTTSIKPILIYLTLDGRYSHIALKVDEIADVEEVRPEDIVSYDDVGLPHFDKTRQFVDAYMRLESGKECLLIRPDKILTNKEMLAVKEAV